MKGSTIRLDVLEASRNVFAFFKTTANLSVDWSSPQTSKKIVENKQDNFGCPNQLPSVMNQGTRMKPSARP